MPNLHDLTLDAARHKLLEAGCTLGRIEIIGNGPRSGFIVETQNPPAGSVRRFHFAVNVAVLKGRHGNKHG